MLAAPVPSAERIATLDLIRGFAVLGILLVNVWSYGMMYPASLDPHLIGYDTLGDHIVYALVFMLAYTKTMPIFALLFGAGIALFAERQESRGVKPAGVFLKRQFWLWVIGLVHAYLVWDGDILVPYACVGAGVFFLRRKSLRTLIILAILAIFLPLLGGQAGGFFMGKMRTEAESALAARAAGEDLTAEQIRLVDQWGAMGGAWSPTEDQLAETREIMTGPHWDMVSHSAPETLMAHLVAYPMIINWNLAAYMLLGMVLYRTGILTGARSKDFYRSMIALGYGLGFPLSILALYLFFTRFDFIFMIRFGFPLMNVSGPLVAAGHVALLCLLWKSGTLPRLQARLRAVGRMAFTSYLSHTLICGFLFFGFGLGMFGTLSRTALLGVTLMIWIWQLWFSSWWLKRFRFGPLEWLWRTLTYGKTGPLRRGTEGAGE